MVCCFVLCCVVQLHGVLCCHSPKNAVVMSNSKLGIEKSSDDESQALPGDPGV
jgi:hypothetical protein